MMILVTFSQFECWHESDGTRVSYTCEPKERPESDGRRERYGSLSEREQVA